MAWCLVKQKDKFTFLFLKIFIADVLRASTVWKWGKWYCSYTSTRITGIFWAIPYIFCRDTRASVL